MEKALITMDNVSSLNYHLNEALHDIMICVGKLACTDIMIDLASIQNDLYFSGKSQLFVHNMHCDTTHRMSEYCFKVMFHVSHVTDYEAHVTVVVDWLDDEDNLHDKDAMECKKQYKEILSRKKKIYNNIIY